MKFSLASDAIHNGIRIYTYMIEMKLRNRIGCYRKKCCICWWQFPQYQY